MTYHIKIMQESKCATLKKITHIDVPSLSSIFNQIETSFQLSIAKPSLNLAPLEYEKGIPGDTIWQKLRIMRLQ